MPLYGAGRGSLLPCDNLRVLDNVDGLTVLSETKENLSPKKIIVSHRGHPSEISSDFTGQAGFTEGLL